jgi:hypothetical protein
VTGEQIALFPAPPSIRIWVTRAPRRARPQEIPAPLLPGVVWPEPNRPPAGARHWRDAVRLARTARRPTGLVHIASRPWNFGDGRLYASYTAVCGVGIVDVEQRRTGLAKEATCRRCRNIVRHLPKDTRFIFPGC